MAILNSPDHAYYMTLEKEELLDHLAKCLNQHFSKLRGYPRQEPYKTDIAIIYRSLHQRKKKAIYFDEVLELIKPKLENINEEVVSIIRMMWDEWVYAKSLK